MKISVCPNQEYTVSVPVGSGKLEGCLTVPENAVGVVVFAHGSGSSRYSPRNRYVAGILRQNHLGTLLIDLLKRSEQLLDQQTRHLRFDIGLLVERLLTITDWLTEHPTTRKLNLGYFGASTGSAAALMAAVERPEIVKALVSRGGRPDLAGSALSRVQIPTLLIVGGNDISVLRINQKALAQLHGEKQLEIIPEATHLFEEPGTLEKVAQLASQWFGCYLETNSKYPIEN